MNKKFIFLVIYIWSNIVQADPGNSNLLINSWIGLSGASQNASLLQTRIKPGQVADPTMAKSIVSDIDKSLEALVKAGFLQKKVFTFAQGDVLHGDSSKLNMFIYKISEKFGYYTSLELLDLGLEHSLKVFNEDENVTLEIFLPTVEMQEFENYSKEFRIGS